MILCDEQYYEAEEIDGFYVTSMMKRFWLASLESLCEIDRICKKNNIKYFLVYGSLLGAIRHAGYIPWDDDLDIGMLREDYNRFVEIAKREVEKPFVLVRQRNESCIYPANFTNSCVPQVGDEFLSRFHGCPYAAGVDIFPLDNIPDSVEERNEFFQIYRVVRYLSQRLDPKYKSGTAGAHLGDKLDHPSDEELEEVIIEVEKYMNITIERGKYMHETFALIAKELAQRYNTEPCEYVAYINDLDLPEPQKDIIPRKAFEYTVDADFEGLKFPVPKDYEMVLECYYGEGWRVPVQNGASHIYPVYRRQAEQLEKIVKAYGATVPEYFYL